MNSAYYFLSFALMQKKGTKTKSRLNENFLFSTDRLKHAIQAAPMYILHLDVGVLQTFERSLEKVPMYASVSLTNAHRIEPSLENLRNFHKVKPTNYFAKYSNAIIFLISNLPACWSKAVIRTEPSPQAIPRHRGFSGRRTFCFQKNSVWFQGSVLRKPKIISSLHYQMPIPYF
jgi:hypothetical protein